MDLSDYAPVVIKVCGMYMCHMGCVFRWYFLWRVFVLVCCFCFLLSLTGVLSVVSYLASWDILLGCNWCYVRWMLFSIGELGLARFLALWFFSCSGLVSRFYVNVFC